MYILGDARCSKLGAISMAVKDMPGSLADSMLTGTTNQVRLSLSCGSDDCQVTEDRNEVDCLGIINNDIQAI